MLAEKFFPPGSGRYGRLATIVEKMDGFASLKPERWFGIWAMVLAGANVSAHVEVASCTEKTVFRPVGRSQCFLDRIRQGFADYLVSVQCKDPGERRLFQSELLLAPEALEGPHDNPSPERPAYVHRSVTAAGVDDDPLMSETNALESSGDPVGLVESNYSN